MSDENISQVTSSPETQPVDNTSSFSPAPKKSNKMLVWAVIFLVVVLALGVGSYFLINSGKSIPSSSTPAVTPTPTPTPTSVSKVTLNPNTGNLYQDIKVRLDEVFK